MILTLSEIFEAQGEKYDTLTHLDKQEHNTEIMLCRKMISKIFAHLKIQFSLLSKKLSEYVKNASKEIEEVNQRITEIKRKWELEERLLKNEIEVYERVEGKSDKARVQSAFDILEKHYKLFRQFYKDNIGEVKSYKDQYEKSLDDLRFSIIDDLKTFYVNEIQQLIDLQSSIIEDPDMAKLENIIDSIDGNDGQLTNRIKSFVNPSAIVI